ncbi:MAG: hypothetical protein CUN55_14260, partial [Phototrophicales bacterium]
LNTHPNANYYLRIIEQCLLNTAQRIKENKPVVSAFLYACLLWPALDALYHSLYEQDHNAQTSMQQAARKTLALQIPHTSMPKYVSVMIREIWELQLQLLKPRIRNPLKIISQPRFRAAYDFLLLRVQAGENLNKRAQWWTQEQAKLSPQDWADIKSRHRQENTEAKHKRRPRFNKSRKPQ